jgi:lysophospholipase L1-like esterase
LLAHELGTGLINLGMPGQCRMEPEVADYIASLGQEGKWDIATLELGINVLSWEEDKIYDRVTNIISAVAGKNPEKPVFVISPFYCNVDFNNGVSADNWRRIIKEICEKLNFKNVTYICGTDILGDISLISADMVHPNIYGVNQIAERLGKVITNTINQ